MKIVLTIVPFQLDRKDKEWTIERQTCPADAEFIVSVFDKDGDNTQFYKDISDADIIINTYVYLDREKIDAMKKCKVISFQCTGFNEIDMDYATSKGIHVCSILDYCTQETAENAFALMLCLQRALRVYDRSIQVDKNWNYAAAEHLQRVEGQTMGIVGLGRIGQSVARKARGFDMRVIAYDPYLPPEIAEKLGVDMVELDTLLAEADVVSIHMNLTDDNHYMFNKETFAKMKKCPILINEGRGLMVSEEALIWALDEGLVRGAGLDMLESESPDLNKCGLLGRDNVIITPHSGYFSDTSEYLVHKLSIENGVHCFKGEFDKVNTMRNHVGRE